MPPPFGAIPQYAAMLQTAANMAAACNNKKSFSGLKGFSASSLFDNQQGQAQKPQMDAVKVFQQFLTQQVSTYCHELVNNPMLFVDRKFQVKGDAKAGRVAARFSSIQHCCSSQSVQKRGRRAEPKTEAQRRREFYAW